MNFPIRSGAFVTLLTFATLSCGGAAPGRIEAKAQPDDKALGPPGNKQLDLRLGQSAPGRPAAILSILQGELERSLSSLSKEASHPPHHLAYQVVEQDRFAAAASLGALVNDADSYSRTLDVTVRVGTNELDNTHPVRGHFDPGRYYSRATSLPLKDEPGAIARKIWLTTHAEHQRAVEELFFVKANRDVKVAEEDDSGDFTDEPPVQYLEPLPTLDIARDDWKRRLPEYSARLSAHRELLESSVGLDAVAERTFLVNSDGSRVQTGRIWARLVIHASTIAQDGMELSRTEILDARRAVDLPEPSAVRAAIDRVADDVLALRSAPVVEPYAGPAILDGKAAGVFFHEIFGHRVEGHRQKDAEEGQTFARKIGQPIMPSFLDVYDDPRAAWLDGTPLNGHYAVDDEGVRAARANLVEDGVLRGFLMSRSPTRGFEHSNGHGRRQSGHRVVARQGNLIVDPARVTTRAGLNQLLIDEIKRQEKPFGLRFSEITGGYTTTTTDGAQAFKVLPIMVYRVFPDGREELVRGVDLEGTPLTVLSKIVAAADDFQIFNGMCGAESGWVPVSAASPSLLVSQVEVARRERSQERPPLLPPPSRTKP